MPTAERPAADANAAKPTSGTAPNAYDELIIFGGEQIISSLWWRNAEEGYGIVQVRADTLVRTLRQEDSDERPIQSTVGLDALDGELARSVLCRETIFDRQPAPPADAGATSSYRDNVTYVPFDRGIVFCKGLPAYPFYPEGVVLAYLHPEDPNDPKQSAADQAAYRDQFVAATVTQANREAFLATIDLDGPENATISPAIVESLSTEPTIPLTAGFRTPAGGPISTIVCAEISSLDRTQERNLLFQLVHVLPEEITTDAQPAITPDRMQISGITEIALSCADVKRQNLSGGATSP